MSTGSRWSPQDEFILKQLYANTSNDELAELLGRLPRNVGMKARKMGLCKSPEYMATGPGCFRPGQEPPNKGRSWSEWNPSADACRATQFKRGNKPHTWNPVGHERITRDGSLERKVSDTGVTRRDYVPVARLVWEQHNGPIPRGHAVVFKPGRHTTDAALITPDTLDCMTRAELMRRNSYHNYPKPIARLIQLRGALNRKINNRSKA